MNTKKIKITGYPITWDGTIGTPIGDESKVIQLKIQLKKLCLMRTAEKVGDIETINHTQLGRLKQSGIQFEII